MSSQNQQEAHAGIGGVPIQNGLYAAAAGGLIYAMFGTSRQISTGPSSALAVLAAGMLTAAGASSGDQAVQVVTAVTLVSGVLAGVALHLARVKPPVERVIRADGVVKRLGEDHLHMSAHEAMEALSDDI